MLETRAEYQGLGFGKRGRSRDGKKRGARLCRAIARQKNSVERPRPVFLPLPLPSTGGPVTSLTRRYVLYGHILRVLSPAAHSYLARLFEGKISAVSVTRVFLYLAHTSAPSNVYFCTVQTSMYSRKWTYSHSKIT